MNGTNQSSSSPKVLCFHWHSIIHDDYVVSDYFFTVLATIVNLLTCPFIILLNAIVITAIVTKQRLRTMYNILLACLAVTDLLVGIVAQPLLVTLEIMLLASGTSSVPCRAFNLNRQIVLALCLASYLYLAVISVERYVAMKYSLRYSV